MLGHAEATLLSELPISNYKWRGRIKVLHGVKGEEEAVYDITMVKVHCRSSTSFALLIA